MENIVDIAKLVEENPLVKFSNENYQSDFVDRLRTKFSTSSQQLFLASFYCYLNCDPKEFTVSLRDHWKWLGFSRFDHAKTLLVKEFTPGKDYNSFSATAGKLNKVGRPTEDIKMTVRCFKKLCLKARTDKADEIHDYYLDLEETVNDYVKEKSELLRNQLTLKDIKIKSIVNSNENIMILNFRNKQVIYLIMVDGVIIKFGHTKNIEERMKSHRVEFGTDIKLISVFETVYNREFESMIKKDGILNKHIISKKYKNNQTELIQLSKDFTLEKLNKRMEYLKDVVNGDLVAKLLKENDELKLENTKLKLKLRLVETSKFEEEKLKVQKQTYEMNMAKLNVQREHSELKDRSVGKNESRYQVYDQTTLKLVKTYDNIEQLCNETKLFKSAIRQSVYRNARSNKVYKGYRFLRLERTQEIKEYKIPQTIKISNAPTYEQVVQLNIEQTTIVNIFSCAADAAEKLSEQTGKDCKKIKKSITNNLSETGTAYGYRWRWVSKVGCELLDKYLETNELPEVRINKASKKVYKFDIIGSLIVCYKSMSEAKKTEKVSEPTLRKAIKNKTQMNGSYWSFSNDFKI